MVGVINPNGTQTLDSQIRAARAADFQIAPGEAIPDEVSATLAAPSAGSSSIASDPTARSSKLSSGAIAGIVVGSFLFALLLVGIFIYFLLRRNNGKDVSIDRRKVKQVYQKSSTVEPPPVELSANEEIPKNPTNHELRTPDDCKRVLPSGCIYTLDKKQ
jgi:hypothetical protein